MDITLEITRKCPLNCLFCSSNGGMPHPRELNLSEWFEVIDQSISLGASSFLISGGEPFSSPFLREICQHISNNDVNLTVYTCGNIIKDGQLSPLEKTDLEFLLGLKSANLVFNVQGANSNIHEKVTNVKGSFENVMSSISSSVECGLRPEIHFVPISINYKVLPDVVSLSKDLDVKKVSVLRFVPQGRGKENEPKIKLGEDNVMELRDIISNFCESGFVRIGSPFSPFGVHKKNDCTAGQNRMTIRFDGKVVPCEAMKFLAEDFQDNDVRKTTIKKIWCQSELFTQIRAIQSSDLTSECKNCDLLLNCKGGCIAQRLISKNSMNTFSEPYCFKRVIAPCQNTKP